MSNSNGLRKIRIAGRLGCASEIVKMVGRTPAGRRAELRKKRRERESESKRKRVSLITRRGGGRLNDDVLSFIKNGRCLASCVYPSLVNRTIVTIVKVGEAQWVKEGGRGRGGKIKRRKKRKIGFEMEGRSFGKIIAPGSSRE